MIINKMILCSWSVKIRLFKAFCVCFYDIDLWCNFKLGTINKLAAAYTRCLKFFFDFYKYSSVTDMLLQLGLPTFNTILHNSRFSFMARVTSSVNVLVQSTLMCC